MSCPNECVGYSRDRLLFAILSDDVQEKATERIGRALTEQELWSVQNGIEHGLGELQWDIIETAIDLAVDRSQRSSR